MENSGIGLGYQCIYPHSFHLYLYSLTSSNTDSFPIPIPYCVDVVDQFRSITLVHIMTFLQGFSHYELRVFTPEHTYEFKLVKDGAEIFEHVLDILNNGEFGHINSVTLDICDISGHSTLWLTEEELLLPATTAVH